MRNSTLLLFVCFLFTVQADAITKTVHMSTSGTLSSLLGDEIGDISELILTGNIIKEDIAVLKIMIDEQALRSVDLTEVIIEDFPYDGPQMHESSFKDCVNLEVMKLPLDLVHMAPYSFYGCTSLKSIEIHEGMYTVSGSVFAECTSLEEVILPRSVPGHITELGTGCFRNCVSLKEISIPEDYEINRECFIGASLERIVCRTSTPPMIEQTSFDEEHKKNAIVYIPKGSLESYKSDEYWREFNYFVEFEGEEIPTSNQLIPNENYSVTSINSGIQITTTVQSDFKVFDINGKLVKSVKGEGSLNISLEKGIYIVTSELGNKKILVK